MKGGKNSLALLALGKPKSKGDRESDDEADDGAFDEAFEEFASAMKDGKTGRAKEAFRQAVQMCDH